jgi:hypothetical protein
MPYAVGVGLALAVCLFATLLGYERDRAFYPTMAIVVASYYALFAVMGGSTRALGIESVVILLFLAASVLGFKLNLWFAVGALVGHGLLDFFHARLIENPGVPVWWPQFCGAFDVAAGGYLAILLSRSRVAAIAVVLLAVASGATAQELFELPKGVETRWYSFENPTGQPGNGGRANEGRKGAPSPVPASCAASG